jgi:hypothetical protein
MKPVQDLEYFLRLVGPETNAIVLVNNLQAFIAVEPVFFRVNVNK